MPEAQVAIMEQLVKKGIYRSKSDIVREAIRDLLRKHLWLLAPNQRAKFKGSSRP